MADEAPAPAALPVGAQDATKAQPISFADDTGGDAVSTLLDEVLSGAPEASEAEPAKPEPVKPVEPEPAKAEAPDAVRLRKGFAKLAEERQKVIELQNAARAEKASAASYIEKAKRFDEAVELLGKDPVAFLKANGGEEMLQRTLQGMIDAEKSPESRRIDQLEKQAKADKEAAAQREQEAVVTKWRNDIAAKVQADDRFDLVNSFGLHGEVIDVITGYYEKHSERDDKGNVTVPAILPWDTAAQAVENTKAERLEASKRYGKRAPVVVEPPKDAPKAKDTPAPAKRAPTSLSAVPVAETPSEDEVFPDGNTDERFNQVMKSLGMF
jgi:hypothetical protein